MRLKINKDLLTIMAIALVGSVILTSSPSEARPRHHKNHATRLVNVDRVEPNMPRYRADGSLEQRYASYSKTTHRRSNNKRVKPTAVYSGFSSSIVSVAKSQIGNGAIYGRRNLWCARFMNWVLERSGHKGTGSDMATSFRDIGTRVSGPQIGAIAIMPRRGGGHVGVVVGITPDGDPILVSGNHRNRVMEAVYPHERITTYVVL